MSTSTTSTTEKARVALLQFKVTEDKSQNHETAISFISKAASEKAKLVVLPEIWNGPYATSAFPEYAEQLPNVGDNDSESESAKVLMEQAKKHNIWIVGGSISEKINDKIYNTCLCINPTGEIVAKHQKVHLFDINVPGKIKFLESDTLSPGTSITSFLMTEWGINIGIGICYDIRFPEYASCLIQHHSCSILIFPGAFNLTTGPMHWELLQRARAVDGQCFVLTASPARTEAPQEPGKYPHYTAWGHSTAVSPWGNVIETCDEKEHVIICDLDLNEVREMRSSIPTSIQKRKDLYQLTDVKK